VLASDISHASSNHVQHGRGVKGEFRANGLALSWRRGGDKSIQLVTSFQGDVIDGIINLNSLFRGVDTTESHVEEPRNKSRKKAKSKHQSQTRIASDLIQALCRRRLNQYNLCSEDLRAILQQKERIGILRRIAVTAYRGTAVNEREMSVICSSHKYPLLSGAVRERDSTMHSHFSTAIQTSVKHSGEDSVYIDRILVVPIQPFSYPFESCYAVVVACVVNNSR
jgi:hypothetical protein